jgi:hypothetical protein
MAQLICLDRDASIRLCALASTGRSRRRPPRSWPIWGCRFPTRSGCCWSGSLPSGRCPLRSRCRTRRRERQCRSSRKGQAVVPQHCRAAGQSECGGLNALPHSTSFQPRLPQSQSDIPLPQSGYSDFTQSSWPGWSRGPSAHRLDPWASTNRHTFAVFVDARHKAGQDGKVEPVREYVGLSGLPSLARPPADLRQALARCAAAREVRVTQRVVRIAVAIVASFGLALARVPPIRSAGSRRAVRYAAAPDKGPHLLGFDRIIAK